jgi:hypothetical protein
MRVSTAPGREIRAVRAGPLNQADDGQWLAFPESQGFPAKPFLNGAEAFHVYALLHLAEVNLGWNLATVATGETHFSAPPESLHQVFHIRYLLQLTQHDRSHITFRIVDHWLLWAFEVEAFP